MKLPTDDARTRLGAHVHGVLCTLHPERGPDAQPVVYVVSDDGHVGVPIDRVKPKSSSRLQREDTLRPTRAARYWSSGGRPRTGRGCGGSAPGSSTSPTRRPGSSTSSPTGWRAVPKYADKPFHRVLVFRIVDVTGWAANKDA